MEKKEVKKIKTDDNGKGVPIIQNRKAKKSNDSKVQDQDNSPTSSSRMLDLEKAKAKVESRLNCEAHPINNDLILKNIFEFSSAKDLKNIRLVSKRWRDLSLKAWREKAVLRTERLFGGPIHGLNEAAAMEEFNKNASKLLKSPFQRYDVEFNDSERSGLPPDVVMKQKIMKLKLFSSSIQHLNVCCDHWDLMTLLLTKLPQLRTLNLQLAWFNLYRMIALLEDGEGPLRDLQPATSKLSKLELNLRQSHFIEPLDHIRMPWKELFQNLPALKFLRLDSCGGRAQFEEVIQSICEVRKETNFTILNLEELCVVDPNEPPLADRVVTNITESQFPLNAFGIDLKSDFDSSTFSDLLRAHADTLEVIKYYIGSQEDCRRRPALPLVPYFPSKITLPSLKKLLLRNDCVKSFHFLFSLDLPNLEDLRMESKTDFDLIRQPYRPITVTRQALKLKYNPVMDSCLFLNLKNFFVDHVSTNFSSPDLQCLEKSMPNLTDLGIPLGNGIFPTIYKLWPGLQSLHLVATGNTYSLLDDCVIAGFQVLKNRSARSRKSNITGLKNLRKFILETKSDGGRNLPRPRKPCISDVSAIHGFLELPKLDILELETVCKYSPKVMAALKSHVSEIKIREPDIFKAPR